MEIGEKIKMRRMELGWSQRELARKMGYKDNSTLARIEMGTVDVSQTRIVQFSEVLGVSIAYLMDWEEVQENNDTLADIIVRMRTDEDFSSIIKMLNSLKSEQLVGIKSMLSTFVK